MNTRKDESIENEKFRIYHLYLQNCFDHINDFLFYSISSKKLSYARLSTFLNKYTFFGVPLTINREDNRNIRYTWFEEIDLALKDFFQQCTKMLSGKKADWRITIDILSIKFEGILRDIINISSGGITTKIDDRGTTTEWILDDLLRCDDFLKIFNEDDRNLFLYTFTNKGLNIRNYVAHSFYKRQDYTVYKAVLVLLSILRLSKYDGNKN